jgi:hypothetical protein
VVAERVACDGRGRAGEGGGGGGGGGGVGEVGRGWSVRRWVLDAAMGEGGRWMALSPHHQLTPMLKKE